MKRLVVFLFCMMINPIILTYGASLFCDKIDIGQGGNLLENKRLGKEVLMEINGLYKSVDVEEYVLGILAGTIPAEYDMETLKVQAILVRTNVLKEMQEENTSDAADMSFQYLTVEDRITFWGDKNYEKYEKRFERAVAETAGMVIKKEDSLIMALYHEVSIGKTAGAKEILGEDISYLQSVESSQDVEAKHYLNLVIFTWEDLQQRVSTWEKMSITEEDMDVIQTEGQNGTTKPKFVNQADEEGEQKDSEQKNKEVDETDQKQETEKIYVSIEESTENGFVKTISINGNIYTGEEAMQQLGLSSTNFYVEEMENGVRFVCLGKGNCLGVSQYGANRMALEGKTAEEIIRYYYQGVSIVKYQSE